MKLLVFHSALAPYRVDLFNELNLNFESDFYFFSTNLQGQKFNTKKLIEKLNFTPNYYTFGFNVVKNHKLVRIIRLFFETLIIKHKPDIILCWEFNNFTIKTILFTKIFYPRIRIFTLCDDSIELAQNSGRLRKIAIKFCIKFLEGVIFVNPETEKWYGTRFPKLRTFYFPIIQNEVRLLDSIDKVKNIANEYNANFNLVNKMRILFVGRFAESKNLVWLIHTFNNYLLKNPSAILILVGDGEQKSELEKLILTLELKEHVIIVGRYENEELYAWYFLADLFILPSIYEPFGAVVNESLIFGTPVLCSDIAGASCLIQKGNGKLINPKDRIDLDELIKEIHFETCYHLNKKSLVMLKFHDEIEKLINFLKK